LDVFQVFPVASWPDLALPSAHAGTENNELGECSLWHQSGTIDIVQVEPRSQSQHLIYKIVYLSQKPSWFPPFIPENRSDEMQSMSMSMFEIHHETSLTTNKFFQAEFDQILSTVHPFSI
jgi:hypothetical protein